MENCSASKSVVSQAKIQNQKENISNDKEVASIESELRALRKLYHSVKGNIIQKEGLRDLDENSRLLLKKLLDGASKHTSQSHAMIKAEISAVPPSTSIQREEFPKNQELELQSTKEIEIGKETRKPGEFDSDPVASKLKDNISRRRPKKIKITSMEQNRQTQTECRICKKHKGKHRNPVKEGIVSGGSSRRTKKTNKNHDHRHHHHHSSKERKKRRPESESNKLRDKTIHKNHRNSASSRNQSATPDNGNEMPETLPPGITPTTWVRTELGSFKKDHKHADQNEKPEKLEEVAAGFRRNDEQVPAAKSKELPSQMLSEQSRAYSKSAEKKQSQMANPPNQMSEPKCLPDQMMSQTSGPNKVKDFPSKMRKGGNVPTDNNIWPVEMFSGTHGEFARSDQMMDRTSGPSKVKDMPIQENNTASQGKSEVTRAIKLDLDHETRNGPDETVHSRIRVGPHKEKRTIHLDSPPFVGSIRKKNSYQETKSGSSEPILNTVKVGREHEKHVPPKMTARQIQENHVPSHHISGGFTSRTDELPSHQVSQPMSRVIVDPYRQMAMPNQHAKHMPRLRPPPIRLRSLPRRMPSQSMTRQTRNPQFERGMLSQHRGTNRVESTSKTKSYGKMPEKRAGRLKRYTEKLGLIFHHHHHHYVHHPGGGDERGGVGSLSDTSPKPHHGIRKYLGNFLHHSKKVTRGKHLTPVSRDHAARNAPHHQHGFLVTLLEGLLSHVWHPRRKGAKAMANRKRLGKTVRRHQQVKRLNWWPRFHRRRGVKLTGRKKPRFRLAFRTHRN